MSFMKGGENIEFESPASRVIEQFSGQDKEQFRVPTNLPDLTFLRALSVQGRLIYQTGSVANDAADIITITPSNGSTLFVYRIIFSSFATVATFTSKNNGITRILVTLGGAGTSGLVVDSIDSLVGDGIKTYVVNASVTGGNGKASLLGWTENTSRIRDVTV